MVQPMMQAMVQLMVQLMVQATPYKSITAKEYDKSIHQFSIFAFDFNWANINNPLRVRLLFNN